MDKSTDRNLTIEAEFFKLQKVLEQTAEDTSNCLNLLEKHLSEYDTRNKNHFVNTASSYLRNDVRIAYDSIMELRHVAHQIDENQKSKTEIESARNVMDATSKAMQRLTITGRNYDKENGQSKGIKGTLDAALGHEKNEKKEGMLDGIQEEETSRSDLYGGLGSSADKNGGGIMGTTETVETIVKKTLRDHFSLKRLEEQISATDKAISPTMMERAKETFHGLKEKVKGEKAGATNEG